MNQIKIAVGVIAFLILANMFFSYNNISFDFFNKEDEVAIIKNNQMIEDEKFEFARNTDFCYIDDNDDEVCRIEFSNEKKLVSIEVLKRDSLFLRKKSVILSIQKVDEQFCLRKLQVESYTRNVPSNRCSQVFFKYYE